MWFSFDVSDKTGTIPVKFWGRSDEAYVKRLFSSFDVNDVVSIKGGRIEPYQGNLEVNLSEGSCEIRKEIDFDYADFAATAIKDIPKMISEFRDAVESVADDDIRRLLKSIFEDDVLMKRYSESPAAKSYHHGYVGGLLEHSLSMIAMSRTVAKRHEPDLELDLMVAGCMLHDIGKIFQYETKTVIDFTVEGGLLGHISMGAKMVEDKIDELEGFPTELKNKVLHLILSHHGSHEAGSPVTPHFPEAVALHKIDDCDAQTKHAIQVKKRLLETTDKAMSGADRRFGFMYLK